MTSCSGGKRSIQTELRAPEFSIVHQTPPGNRAALAFTAIRPLCTMRNSHSVEDIFNVAVVACQRAERATLAG